MKRRAWLRLSGVSRGTPGQQHGMVALGQRQIVGGAERLLAERLEVEPGDARGGPRHLEPAAADRDHRGRARGAVGQRGEGLLEPGVGRRRRAADDRPATSRSRVQAVVGGAGEADHREPLAAAAR